MSTSEVKKCTKCAQKFEVTPEDLAFYDKVSPIFAGKKQQIPPPTLCPDCRKQRRLSFRNERKLYHRKCDLCNKQIISVYSSDKPHTVYCSECWWSDKWDADSYATDYDLNKPFFEQFDQLTKKVPKLSLWVSQNENSDYTNDAEEDKNCYLCFGVDKSRDSYYCTIGVGLTDCVDCYWCNSSEKLYNCIFCTNCYNSVYCSDCENTNDSAFCYDCKGCKSCFGSIGLRNKEYHLFNQPLSKENYDKQVQKILDQNLDFNELEKRIKAKLIKYPRRDCHQKNCQNCTGDYLINCKNATNCFESIDLEDSKNVCISFQAHHGMDANIIAYGTNMFYECQSVIGSGTNVLFSSMCRAGLSDCIYVTDCQSSSNLFGCTGMRNKKFCILNKQYSEEEYNELLPKIIQKMIEKNEWGEFFPIATSPFAYNETNAQDYFPLDEMQILKNGYAWREPDTSIKYNGPIFNIPTTITETNDEIIREILTCQQCTKNYKIIPQELDFYRKQNLPVPHSCPDCRHSARMAKRNPNHLYDRACAKCQTPIQTTYSPERPEIVYCEKCYLEEVY